MTVKSNSAPGIIVDNVCLTLAGHRVLSELSLQLSGGQWHCVLGRSGVGKSSFLRLLAGLLCSDSGTVTADNGRALPQQLSFMAQDDGLLPWLSVLENVQLGARLRGNRGEHSRSRAEQLLVQLDLLAWKDELPDKLSGGMRQRVALARTLHEQCKVVLMDEPFSRLDAVTRDELQRLAFSLLESCTVVLVTHDPLEALRLAHSITVLQSGQPTGLVCWQPSFEPLREIPDLARLDLLPDLWDALRSEPQQSRSAS